MAKSQKRGLVSGNQKNMIFSRHTEQTDASKLANDFHQFYIDKIKKLRKAIPSTTGKAVPK